MTVTERSYLPATRPDEASLHWLAGELPSWTRDGLLTEDQARRIRGRYDFAEVDLDRKAGPGRLVQALSILGALLVGAGILTWVAANWDGMPDALRLTMIFGGVIGLNAGGYELAFRRANHPHVGQALLFVGSASYGAGIFLVAQIFHLSGHWPNAFLAWGSGALAVAVAVESLPVFVLAAGAMSVWGIGEAVSFHATGLWGLAAVGVMLALAYWRQSKGHVQVAVLALGAWLAIVPTTWGSHEELFPVAWLTGAAVLVAVGSLHRSAGRDDLATPWRMAGIGGGMFAVFLLGIRPVAESLAWRTGAALEYGALPVLLLAAAAVSVAAVVRARGRLPRSEAAAALGALGLAVAWLLLGSRENATGASLVCNVALFSACAGLVTLGTHERRAWLAWQGLAWFALGLFTLYVDYGWDLVDKSLFFTIGGVLLLAAGWALERQRRRIAAVIRGVRS